MISFILFIVGMAFGIGSFGLGIYYIQGLPEHTELLDAIHGKIDVPNFGDDTNLFIGVALVVLFPIILYIISSWYRKFLVHEIRKGFWRYMTLTFLQCLSFYIIYKSLLVFHSENIPLLHIAIWYLLIFYTFIRIGLYNDYHGKKRYF